MLDPRLWLWDIAAGEAQSCVSGRWGCSWQGCRVGLCKDICLDSNCTVGHRTSRLGHDQCCV